MPVWQVLLAQACVFCCMLEDKKIHDVLWDDSAPVLMTAADYVKGLCWMTTVVLQKAAAVSPANCHSMTFLVVLCVQCSAVTALSMSVSCWEYA